MALDRLGLALAMSLAASLAACTGGSGGAAPGRSPGPEAARAEPAAVLPVRVTWEALAVERERFENPTLESGRSGRRPRMGIAPDQKIVLVNESHPLATSVKSGRVASRAKDGSVVTILPDEDMALFLRGLEQEGFFRVARPTDYLRSDFASDAARGRITVERGDESVSIVSMRGQGLVERTKDVPRLYSEVKQTVAVLRNRTPTLNVITSGARSTAEAPPAGR
jgi:hypothetical protein